MRIPRFSLLFVFIFVTVISFWLGMAAYVYEGRQNWREVIWIPFGCLWCGFVYWLFSPASWSARIIVIGFFVGVSVEIAAMNLWIARDWIEYPPPSYEPMGSYPVTLPANRILIAAGLTDPFSISFRPWVLGMMVSGAIAGALFYFTRRFFLQNKLLRQSRSDDMR